MPSGAAGVLVGRSVGVRVEVALAVGVGVTVGVKVLAAVAVDGTGVTVSGCCVRVGAAIGSLAVVQAVTKTRKKIQMTMHFLMGHTLLFPNIIHDPAWDRFFLIILRRDHAQNTMLRLMSAAPKHRQFPRLKL